MRKYLMLTMAIAALIAVSVAGIATGANKPTVVEAGNLVFTFNGGFSPSKLPNSSVGVLQKSQPAKASPTPASSSLVFPHAPIQPMLAASVKSPRPPVTSQASDG